MGRGRSIWRGERREEGYHVEEGVVRREWNDNAITNDSEVQQNQSVPTVRLRLAALLSFVLRIGERNVDDRECEGEVGGI